MLEMLPLKILKLFETHEKKVSTNNHKTKQTQNLN